MADLIDQANQTPTKQTIQEAAARSKRETTPISSDSKPTIRQVKKARRLKIVSRLKAAFISCGVSILGKLILFIFGKVILPWLETWLN